MSIRANVQSIFRTFLVFTNSQLEVLWIMDAKIEARSTVSRTNSTGEDSFLRSKKISAKDIVQGLTSFVRFDKEGNKEFVVVKCPKGQYCKNPNAEIRYQNKTGFKNPCSHLRTCLARVRTMCASFLFSNFNCYGFCPG